MRKFAGWGLGMLCARLVALRPGFEVHPISRFDGMPVISMRSGARVAIARRVRIFRNVRFTLEGSNARISIGERSFVNRGSEVIAAESVTIGSGCAISWDVCVTDTDFHEVIGTEKSAPVVIGDRVWIGAGAMILKGVTIGDGAIVAARSVVTRDVAPRTLVGGNPARVIRDEVDWKL